MKVSGYKLERDREAVGEKRYCECEKTVLRPVITKWCIYGNIAKGRANSFIFSVLFDASRRRRAFIPLWFNCNLRRCKRLKQTISNCCSVIYFLYFWLESSLYRYIHTWLFASATFDSGSFNFVFAVGFSLCYFARFWLEKQLSFLLWKKLSSSTCLLLTTTHFYAYGYSRAIADSVNQSAMSTQLYLKVSESGDKRKIALFVWVKNENLIFNFLLYATRSSRHIF